MYIPASFRESRIEILHAFICAHPFGLLISAGDGGLQATPLPFQLEADGGNGTLRAHMARANPHGQALAGAAECLVVFQGEQGYVTPSWYASKQATGKAVPTWNYAAVQARGRPRVVEDAAWLRPHLERLTQAQEGRRAQPWAVDDAPEDYLAAQMKAIVGIEIPIARIEGKWKMSQNRDTADRRGVIAGLRDAGDPHRDPALADLVEIRMKDGP